MTTPVPSFLIVSSSFLQALRTPINSRMDWKFGQIILWTVELAALEHLENLHRLIMGECCDLSNAFNFEWIFLILADRKNNYKSLDEFEIRQDPITYYGVSSP